MSADRPETTAPLAEIAHGPSPFEQFLDKNQKLLVVFAFLLVIAAAGIVVYRGVEHSRQLTAGAVFFNANDLPELRKLIDEHSGTQAASSARILLAEEQWSAGQQDDAIATLRDFIDANAKHPALASARASLGSKLMTQGQAAEAAAAFQQIIDDPRSRYLAPYALISLGDLARVVGDADKAETLYSRARADYPESGFASTAAGRLASLKAGMPTEVEPPPLPADPETTAPDDTTALPPAFGIIPHPTEPASEEASDAPPAESAPGDSPVEESQSEESSAPDPGLEPDDAEQP